MSDALIFAIVFVAIYVVIGIALDTVTYNSYKWCKKQSKCSDCNNWNCKFKTYLD